MTHNPPSNLPEKYRLPSELLDLFDAMREDTNAFDDDVARAIASVEDVCNAHAALVAERDTMREALEIALPGLGEYHDGDGAVKFHRINIVRRALDLPSANERAAEVESALGEEAHHGS